MDLLVLADSDGVVDMTPEAISRRTNVPIEEVQKYISELQQPDPTSRSKQEEGRRLVLIDAKRGWGWQIVNYQHYRKIRDEEARRSYFRDAKRKQRKRYNCQRPSVDKSGQVLTPASPSSDSAWLEELSKDKAYEGIDVPHEHAKMTRWCKERKREPTRRTFINWLNRADRKLKHGTDTKSTATSVINAGNTNKNTAGQY